MRAAGDGAASGSIRRRSPASDSAGSTSGVPRKPVDTLPPASRTSGPGPPRHAGARPAARPRAGARRRRRSASRSRARASAARSGPPPRPPARRSGSPMPRPRADGPPPPSTARSRRRTRWPGGPSPPWPPRARSGGASGSSQSPNCVTGPAARPGRAAPPATRPSCACCPTGPRSPRHRRTPRTRTTARWSRRRPSRPGRTAAAPRAPRPGRRSARPAPGPARARGPGASSARTTPRRAAWSRSPTKACASPVQPSRSSRCGQSVGTDTKLSRCDQATFSCSRFSAASPHSNVERSGASLLIATISASRSSAVRLDLGVLEPVERERRLEDRHGIVREHPRVGRSRAPQRAQVERPVRLQDLGVPDRDDGPPRPANGETDIARDVLPAVEQRPAGSAIEPGGRAHADDPHGRREARLDARDVDLEQPGRRPARGVEARRVPSRPALAKVDRAPVVQVGGSDLARGRAPRLVGRDDRRRAVGEAHLELGDDARPRGRTWHRSPPGL